MSRNTDIRDRLVNAAVDAAARAIVSGIAAFARAVERRRRRQPAPPAN